MNRTGRSKGNGQSSRMAFMGHVLMENRNGLLVGACLTRATGTAEREAALALLDAHRPGRRRITLGADKAYDVAAYVEALRARRIGALNASLDLEYGRSIVFFTWAGFDEMDEVNGSGSAELLDDGSLEIEFAYHLGDKATLKAEPATFSAAC